MKKYKIKNKIKNVLSFLLQLHSSLTTGLDYIIFKDNAIVSVEMITMLDDSYKVDFLENCLKD